jgi:hypothetical protein
MKVLIFTDINNTINVHYKTDLITDTQDNFNILSIEGLSDAEITFGLQFKQLAYNLPAFKKFALDHGLKLTAINMNGAHKLETIVDYTVYYNNGGLGLDNL